MNNSATTAPTRKVGILLGTGILLMPYIFGWFLLRDGYSKTAKIIGISYSVLMSLILFSGVFSTPTSQPTPQTASQNSTNSQSFAKPDSPAANTASLLPPVPDAPTNWQYSQNEDPMTGKTTYHASVLSTNTVEFKFPYQGAQNGQLSLRIDPKYGQDVIFSIEKGQILCHSYEDCTVMVRFDDEKPISFSAAGAADNSTETIFIRNYKKFVDKLSKVKRVRISMSIHQEGNPVFEFDVAGFDPNKLKLTK